MRTFEDTRGQAWQAALLEGSYGQLWLVFSPMGGGELRQCPSPAPGRAEAQATLASCAVAELRAWLEAATPWDAAAAGG